MSFVPVEPSLRTQYGSNRAFVIGMDMGLAGTVAVPKTFVAPVPFRSASVLLTVRGMDTTTGAITWAWIAEDGLLSQTSMPIDPYIIGTATITPGVTGSTSSSVILVQPFNAFVGNKSFPAAGSGSVQMVSWVLPPGPYRMCVRSNAPADTTNANVTILFTASLD